MAIRRLYTRQDGKWAWELVVDGEVVATDGGEGYANEAEAREIVNRIIGGEFSDAEKRIRRAPAAAQKAPQDSANEPAANEAQGKQPAAKKTPAKKAAAKKPAQKPGSPASTSGQYQPKRGGSEVTVPKGNRLPPGPRKGEKWVNVDPTKNKSGKKSVTKKESSSQNSTTSTRAIRGAFTTADVRAWAKRNGYAVSDRGRVPKHISGAYRAAHRS